MDYQSIYDQLISKYKDHPKVKFQTNDHHIIPRCFAKVDNIEDIDGRWNRVHLPHRAHFIAHLLLARIWRHHKVKGPKMARAFSGMSGRGIYTSKTYEWLTLSHKMSDEHKQKISEAKKGKSFSSEHIEKLRYRKTESHKEKLRTANLNKKHTAEAKEKIAEAGRNRVYSEETREKISAALKGKPGRVQSDDIKKKISETMKGRPKSEETRRKMSEAQKRVKYARQQIHSGHTI